MQIQPVEKQEVCCCDTMKQSLYTGFMGQFSAVLLFGAFVSPVVVSVYLFNYKVPIEAEVCLQVVLSPESN